MKILHVIDSGGLYGAEMMLLNLATEQIRNGLQPTIASIGESGTGEKAVEAEARNRNIDVELFRMKAGLNLAGAKAIAAYANQNAFQLFHSHGYKGNILLGVLPSKTKKLPVVSTVHGYTSTRLFSKMQIYEFLDSIMLSRLDAVVLVNRQMSLQPKIKKINNRRITVIDNGIPTNIMPYNTSNIKANGKVSGTDDVIEDFCRNSFVIGSIGRYSKEKGYDLLIKTLAELRLNGHAVKLLIIGEGGERQYLEQLIHDLGLEPFVLLSGYRPNASELMHLMDVYVISSYTEGLPITLLEAMRAKIPVIATSVGGIPEVLENGKCGILIAPGNIDFLVHALTKVIHDAPYLQELVKKAQIRLLSHYSSGRMAKEYQTLYESIIESSPDYQKTTNRE